MTLGSVREGIINNPSGKRGLLPIGLIGYKRPPGPHPLPCKTQWNERTETLLQYNTRMQLNVRLERCGAWAEAQISPRPEVIAWGIVCRFGRRQCMYNVISQAFISKWSIRLDQTYLIRKKLGNKK